MDRYEKVSLAVTKLLGDIGDEKRRSMEALHLYGVAYACALLASRRGLDAQLASVAGLLHDVYRCKTGINRFHAYSGAETARVILKRAGEFNAPETSVILSAIHHHSDKRIVHDEYDELLKDADVLAPYLSGDCKMSGFRAKRLTKVAHELNLPLRAEELTIHEKPVRKPDKAIDKRRLLADVAEALAAKRIPGERNVPEYMEIIRYWPEDEAFDELKNGWCEAFVYHCCQMAGFALPIKLPGESCRLAAVSAWNEWARKPEANFFIADAPDVSPKRGDIVLYRNSIPPENKPEDQRGLPIDHIGVMLGSTDDEFIVAEGNVMNKNVSGILTRPLHRNVEGFIRIDNQYEYGGWRIDYKTTKERIKYI